MLLVIARLERRECAFEGEKGGKRGLQSEKGVIGGLLELGNGVEEGMRFLGD
jgi:hypothetical protein